MLYQLITTNFVDRDTRMSTKYYYENYKVMCDYNVTMASSENMEFPGKQNHMDGPVDTFLQSTLPQKDKWFLAWQATKPGNKVYVTRFFQD